jgi:hypothetical protein
MKKLRNNFKLIISIIIIGLVATTVYAESPVISAAIVKYSNSKSGSSYDTVQGAIDDLYNKSKTNSCKNVAVPNLGDELVPVTIENDGTVTMVDSSSSDWYDYCNKVWANAVILVDGVSYNVGDTISEDDIQSYFVWIPKYKYKLWNIETTKSTARRHSIDIVFDTKDTTDIEGVSCKTPMESGEPGNCDDGEYMTHPAFISLGVDGFWVGKFETGYNGVTNKSDALVDEIDSSKIIIKPNVYSWGRISVYNAFMNGYNYKTNLNSHMMKNTEWGAVVYLSHSEYGINTNININNNSAYLTGYSSTVIQYDYPSKYGKTDSVTAAYNTIVGYKASTTGNISGVYDMSGGSWEYVSAYLSGYLGSSGFTTETITNNAYTKYIDTYTKSGYTGRILGDATGEMGDFTSYKVGTSDSYMGSVWYKAGANALASGTPWISRGGDYYLGIRSSQFNFNHYSGAAYTDGTYRITLAP